jgi:outer membrane protein assembly factor BamD
VTSHWPFPRSGGILLLLTAIVVGGAGCSSTGRNQIPDGTLEPDRFLFERGSEELEQEHWLLAREYFRQLTDTYTQSSYRPDAKLGIGDTYVGEGTPEAIVLGVNEFQEFLAFYPTHERADYAQYRLGMAYFRQMRAAQRDQTETRSAVREFETFVERYPNSGLMPEVRARLREARDRLGTADLEVGVFYYRQGWYPGAIDRLSTLLKGDPEFTFRDKAYFFLAESLVRTNREAEAVPYFERLLLEFESSEYLDDARERLSTIKAESS